MHNVKELKIEAERHGKITVEVLDLPRRIKGCVMLNEDEYTILINKSISDAEQLETYRHELEHIINQDFKSKWNVGELETVRHRNRKTT